MPQMAPINWFTLFIYFSIIMMIFCIINYYIFIYTTPKNKTSKLYMNSLNWKW